MLQGGYQMSDFFHEDNLLLHAPARGGCPENLLACQVSNPVPVWGWDTVVLLHELD